MGTGLRQTPVTPSRQWQQLRGQERWGLAEEAHLQLGGLPTLSSDRGRGREGGGDPPQPPSTHSTPPDPLRLGLGGWGGGLPQSRAGESGGEDCRWEPGLTPDQKKPPHLFLSRRKGRDYLLHPPSPCTPKAAAEKKYRHLFCTASSSASLLQLPFPPK